MAAGNTYIAIFSETLASAQASVTINSIPQTYTDLVLVIQGKMSVDGGTTLYLNGDTTNNNYTYQTLLGDGSTAAGGSGGGAFAVYLDNVIFGSVVCNIMNYANASTYKTTLSRVNTSSYVFARAVTWASTAAVTSLLISNNNSNTYLAGTTFNLYGIKAA
jgi:hypothetical protein